MAGTRRSTRLASSQDSANSTSPSQEKTSPNTAAGSKRKAEVGASPSAKRDKKSKDEKEQKTIEQTMDIDVPEDSNQETKNDKEENSDTKPDETTNGHQKSESQEENKTNGHAGANESKPNGNERSDSSKPAPTEQPQESAPAESQQSAAKPSGESADPVDKNSEVATNGEDAVESGARDEDIPSSILEKGIIYFFYRGRVGIDKPTQVNDIARSYIVLRPLPLGAKLGDGPIGDDQNCCLLALPKKVLPLSGKDKWTAFVETAKTSFKDLKENFMKSSDYETQTVGQRHSPAATPAAEGVYAITSTGRETHLAYILTLPKELGEVQNDLGLRERGSFITSVKNPQAPGPAYASLDKAPEYSQEILDEFRSLRWAPLQPKHLEYAHTQFLLVGESDGIDSATEQQPKDEKEGKDDPKEEMEKLEEEDELRVKHLQGDHAVFTDLGTDAKSYPGLTTTW